MICAPELILLPEVMADHAHPGPLLVPLDAVVVPAQQRVHLAAEGHRLAFPARIKP